MKCSSQGCTNEATTTYHRKSVCSMCWYLNRKLRYLENKRKKEAL